MYRPRTPHRLESSDPTTHRSRRRGGTLPVRFTVVVGECEVGLGVLCLLVVTDEGARPVWGSCVSVP